MMNWLRLQGKVLSVGAIIALVLQLALSFGHLHHEAHAHHADIAHGSPSQPDGSHDADHKHELCAICVAAAFNNAPLGAPPSLSHPIAVETSVDARPSTPATHARLRLTGFQSRAPPHA